jgi:hypothetical protein
VQSPCDLVWGCPGMRQHGTSTPSWSPAARAVAADACPSGGPVLYKSNCILSIRAVHIPYPSAKQYACAASLGTFTRLSSAHCMTSRDMSFRPHFHHTFKQPATNRLLLHKILITAPVQMTHIRTLQHKPLCNTMQTTNYAHNARSQPDRSAHANSFATCSN